MREHCECAELGTVRLLVVFDRRSASVDRYFLRPISRANYDFEGTTGGGTEVGHIANGNEGSNEQCKKHELAEPPVSRTAYFDDPSIHRAATVVCGALRFNWIFVVATKAVALAPHDRAAGSITVWSSGTCLSHFDFGEGVATVTTVRALPWCDFIRRHRLFAP